MNLHNPPMLDEVFTLEAAAHIWINFPSILKQFKRVDTARNIPGVCVSSASLLRSVPAVPRSKTNGKPNGSSSAVAGGDGRPTTRDVTWINIRLEPEDIISLEQSEAELEQLIPAILLLVTEGAGFTVKSTSDRKSFCCFIIGSPSGNNSISYGVSGFGETVRDAVLVCLFKYQYKLGGSFDGVSNVPTTLHSRFR